MAQYNFNSSAYNILNNNGIPSNNKALQVAGMIGNVGQSLTYDSDHAEQEQAMAEYQRAAYFISPKHYESFNHEFFQTLHHHDSFARTEDFQDYIQTLNINKAESEFTSTTFYSDPYAGKTISGADLKASGNQVMNDIYLGNKADVFATNTASGKTTTINVSEKQFTDDFSTKYMNYEVEKVTQKLNYYHVGDKSRVEGAKQIREASINSFDNFSRSTFGAGFTGSNSDIKTLRENIKNELKKSGLSESQTKQLKDMQKALEQFNHNYKNADKANSQKHNDFATRAIMAGSYLVDPNMMYGIERVTPVIKVAAKAANIGKMGVGLAIKGGSNWGINKIDKVLMRHSSHYSAAAAANGGRSGINRLRDKSKDARAERLRKKQVRKDFRHGNLSEKGKIAFEERSKKRTSEIKKRTERQTELKKQRYNAYKNRKDAAAKGDKKLEAKWKKLEKKYSKQSNANRRRIARLKEIQKKRLEFMEKFIETLQNSRMLKFMRGTKKILGIPFLAIGKIKAVIRAILNLPQLIKKVVYAAFLSTLGIIMLSGATVCLLASLFFAFYSSMINKAAPNDFQALTDKNWMQYSVERTQTTFSEACRSVMTKDGLFPDDFLEFLNNNDNTAFGSAKATFKAKDGTPVWWAQASGLGDIKGYHDENGKKIPDEYGMNANIIPIASMARLKMSESLDYYNWPNVAGYMYYMFVESHRPDYDHGRLNEYTKCQGTNTPRVNFRAVNWDGSVDTLQLMKAQSDKLLKDTCSNEYVHGRTGSEFAAVTKFKAGTLQFLANVETTLRDSGYPISPSTATLEKYGIYPVDLNTETSELTGWCDNYSIVVGDLACTEPTTTLKTVGHYSDGTPLQKEVPTGHTHILSCYKDAYHVCNGHCGQHLKVGLYVEIDIDYETLTEEDCFVSDAYVPAVSVSSAMANVAGFVCPKWNLWKWYWERKAATWFHPGVVTYMMGRYTDIFKTKVAWAAWVLDNIKGEIIRALGFDDIVNCDSQPGIDNLRELTLQSTRHKHSIFKGWRDDNGDYSSDFWDLVELYGNHDKNKNTYHQSQGIWHSIDSDVKFQYPSDPVQ